jgi:Tol biopolymer transport system component
MTMTRKTLLAAAALVALALAPSYTAQTATAPGAVPTEPRETHLRNIRQLTFGGENAEAYFSLDGKKIIFQSTREPYKCDQEFTMNTDGSDVKLVSTGRGRTTCGYFTPDGQRLIYASTHLNSPDCPPPPNQSEGYVWAIYPSFDIFSAKLDGTDIKRLTNTQGYDAEGTIAPDGKKIVFTSTRDGDLELYDMNLDGSNPRRLTHDLGYDGGAWHSQDGQWIVWRANRPKTPEEIARYKDLFSRNLVMPAKMELFTMRADGTEQRQITNNGAANFAPYFLPNGRQIIFASNMNDPRGGNFDLFLINRDGTGLQQITFDQNFDGFPMFSPDGKKIVWESNRNSRIRGETNVFIADWVE